MKKILVLILILTTMGFSNESKEILNILTTMETFAVEAGKTILK